LKETPKTPKMHLFYEKSLFYEKNSKNFLIFCVLPRINIRDVLFLCGGTRMKSNQINTTVHLSADDAERLDEGAKKLGKKRSELMMDLMYRVLVHWKKLQHVFEAVKYQSYSGCEWTVKHVSLFPVEYEVCTDMRKFFKYSVSGLLAFAIHVYLDELLEGGEKKARGQRDNNRVAYYICHGKLNNNTICWHTTWHLTDELAQKANY